MFTVLISVQRLCCWTRPERILESHLNLIKEDYMAELGSTYFSYKKYGTDLKTEILAGVSTFLTMAYILFLNPQK